MFNSRDAKAMVYKRLLTLAVAAPLLGAVVLAYAATEKPIKVQASTITGVGRAATPAEVAAWDIDVRPDFKGLPKGSGTVAAGQDIWEAKCASCHGVFGESNEVFSPLVGGTTAADVKSGRVARLLDPSFPGRTTLMKVATVSTLFDYINRAMPWTQPKSLKPNEVYSVVAFLLNLGGVVPDNFTLSDANIAQVQGLMPNRNGMTTRHALWPNNLLGGTQKPDVLAKACMSNCETEVKVSSFLPDFARNAHGNLAEQSRIVGSQRGADTTQAERGANAAGATQAAVAANSTKPKDDNAAQSKAAQALLNKNGCMACHGMTQKIVGPAMTEIAKKHAGKADYLAGKIKQGGTGVWGPIPMPPQTLSEADAKTIAQWLSDGAKR